MTDSMISGSRRCTESYVKVWLPSEAASAGGSGLSDGIRHTTWLRERGITSAALLPARANVPISAAAERMYNMMQLPSLAVKSCVLCAQ